VPAWAGSPFGGPSRRGRQQLVGAHQAQHALTAHGDAPVSESGPHLAIPSPPKGAPAHDLLVSACAWFPEGLDLPDLVEARALLERLQRWDSTVRGRGWPGRMPLRVLGAHCSASGAMRWKGRILPALVAYG
jgi:hypothetical protein